MFLTANSRGPVGGPPDQAQRPHQLGALWSPALQSLPESLRPQRQRARSCRPTLRQRQAPARRLGCQVSPNWSDSHFLTSTREASVPGSSPAPEGRRSPEPFPQRKVTLPKQSFLYFCHNVVSHPPSHENLPFGTSSRAPLPSRRDAARFTGSCKASLLSPGCVLLYPNRQMEETS